MCNDASWACKNPSTYQGKSITEKNIKKKKQACKIMKRMPLRPYKSLKQVPKARDK